MNYIFNLLRSLFGRGVPNNSFPKVNTGVFEEVRETDFVAGTLPFEARNPGADWRAWLPSLDEIQYSGRADSMGCVSFSNTSSLEMQARKLVGGTYNWSDRFLAKLSATTPRGNSLVKVADTVRHYGLVNEATWPKPQDFSWDSFYSEIPSDVILKGKQEFPFSIAYEWVGTDKVSLLKHLQQAPLQITIPGDSPNHAVVLVAIVNNKYYYYDSYAPFLKTMDTPPASALKVVLYSTRIIARQVGWKGSPELGVYIPADTMGRFAFIKQNISTWLPGYDLDQSTTYQIPTSKPF